LPISRNEIDVITYTFTITYFVRIRTKIAHSLLINLPPQAEVGWRVDLYTERQEYGTPVKYINGNSHTNYIVIVFTIMNEAIY